MKTKYKVLYFYPFGPFFPIASGSDIVAANQLEFFRKKNACVDLLIYYRDEKQSQLKQFKNKYSWCNSITELQAPGHAWKFGEFLCVADYVTKIEPLKSMLNQEYDLVFNNYCLTAPIALAAKKAKLKVLETVDHVYKSFAKKSENDSEQNCDLSFYQKIEFDLYKVFNKIIFINREELESTPKINGLEFKWIPPAWPFATPEIKHHNSQYIDILFLGSAHKPNIDGIDFFYNEVFLPHLRKKGIKLTVVGKVCNLWPVEDPSVKKLGFYSGEISEIYQSAKIVIIPILEGTGVSIKTMEAFAFGKAIVSTPLGTRGMKLDGNPLISIDMKKNPLDFANAIVELLDSPEKRENLGNCAFQQFQKEHSFEVYYKRMEDFLELAS